MTWNDPDRRNEYRPFTAGHGESRPVPRASLLGRVVGRLFHPKTLSWIAIAMVVLLASRSIT